MNRSTVRPEGPPVRRVAVLAAVGAGVAVLLTACSAGQLTQTSSDGPSAAGVNASVGSVLIRNAIVANPPIGAAWPVGSDVPVRMHLLNEGDTPDTLVAAGSPIAADVELVNLGATPSPTSGGPTAVGTASASPSGPATPGSRPGGSASPGGAPTAGPAGPSVSASPPPVSTPSPAPSPTSAALTLPPRVLVSLDTAQRQLVLREITTPLAPGVTVPLALRFQRAGDTVLRLPVKLPSGPQPRTSLVHPEDATREHHD